VAGQTVRLWVADLHFLFAMAVRAVGVGLISVAWASMLSSEAQQSADLRALAVVGASAAGVLITQWLTALPPSYTLVELLRPLERDITAVARERAGSDSALVSVWRARLSTMATARIRGGANMPRDRRAWLRVLSRLAESDEA